MHHFVCHCLCNRYKCMRKFYYAMSKGSLFMGTARGKLGEVVMYRANGEQISRVRVRKIANPRSEAQMIQRTFLSTVTKAYSHLSSICDHSFESENGVMKNMARFTKANIDKFRGAFLRANEQWRNNARYNGKDVMLPMFNEYIVSEGTMPVMTYVKGDSDAFFTLAGSGSLSTAPTYADMAQYLGLEKGDQVTIMTLEGVEDNLSAMGELRKHRFILEPSSGEMSTPFLNAGKINLPSSRNENVTNVSFSIDDGDLVVDTGSELFGLAVIASRYENGKWRRSTQTLLVSGLVPATPTLGEAVNSWDTSVTSSLYLNQALS